MIQSSVKRKCRFHDINVAQALVLDDDEPPNDNEVAPDTTFKRPNRGREEQSQRHQSDWHGAKNITQRVPVQHISKTESNSGDRAP